MTTEQTLSEFHAELAAATTPEELSALRTKFLGKKSYVKTALKSLGAMPAEERPRFAQSINDASRTIENALDEADARIKESAAAKQIEAEWQDLTLPGIAQERGSTHPLTQVHKKAMDVMRRLGFTLAEGPEIETPYYNFDAHNHLLRSHTTTVQARVLEQHPPLPIKVVAAGRVYRNEAVDATHLAMFHQFEGIWVEQGLTYGDLKGTLLEIAKSIYGEGHEFRFKPKYYPYTEPSVGMDMQCTVCFGKQENCPA
jgi:phenylalanyl-tRNA synthetase alpha chain